MKEMKNLAFIFTGQGSQKVGMGKDIYDEFELAKKIFDNAGKILNKDIAKICFEGIDLDLTINTQPAILTTELALTEVFKSKCSKRPSFVAGHSLGEYAALHEAEVLDFESVIKLIQKRAELMSLETGGKMAVILGEVENIQNILLEAEKEGVVGVANYNCKGQFVITGTTNAVDKASELFLSAGAKKVIPLAVSGAFHSVLMENAGEKFAEYLNNFVLNSAKIPVVTNIDAEVTTKNFEIKMPKQIYSSVFWEKSIENMINHGIDTFIEFGPARVLSGMNKKINPEIKTYNVFDLKSLEETIEIFEKI